MKLTQEQFDTALQVLEERWGKSKICWVCKTTNWSILPSLFEIREFAGGNLDLTGDVIPMLVLSCVHCGNTAMFSAIKLGLVEPRKDVVAPSVQPGEKR